MVAYRPFTAYYDASGSESDAGDTDTLVIVGLVAPVKEWIEFETEWQTALGEMPYLHMKEFAHSRGPFEKLKGKEPERVALLKGLIKVIKLHVNKVFVRVMIPRDWNTVNERYDLGGRFTPYSFLALRTVVESESWLKKKHPNQPLRHVFEAGDVGQGLLHQFKSEGLHGLSVEPKIDKSTGKWFAPFQAADLVGYEHRLATKRNPTNEEGKFRGAFKQLMRTVPHEALITNREKLTKLCQEHPEVFPLRQTPAKGSTGPPPPTPDPSDLPPSPPGVGHSPRG
jgi:hypothetical protein